MTDANVPLAIVGIGCLFPKAHGPGAYWANIKRGVDCITEVPPTHWDPSDYFDPNPKAPDMTYAQRGGFLSVIDFNPLEFGIAPRDIDATDTSQLLGLVAAKQALEDARIRFSDQADGTTGSVVDRGRVSVILGVTGTLELVVPLGARLGHPRWRKAILDSGVPADVAEDIVQRIGESYVPWQENSFPGLLGNVVAGRIANKLNLHGTNCVVDAACASSLSAVHLAAMELQTGRADVVVSGGVDTFNDIFMFMCFSKTPALSPTGDSKPFDANGDGTILGEGLGIVVLKRLADAERDGDTIYAVMRGLGTSSDGKGNAIYAPSSEGQKRCLTTAYRHAGVTPDTIELLEAHGTGTKVGDAAEASALTDVYNAHAREGLPRPWCAIGSVKSQIGHTKAAAGAASLIKATLALHYKVLPPTLKVQQPVEPLRDGQSPFYVNTAMRPWLPREQHPRRAAVSAFGFGGSNFHCVLEEHTPAKTSVDWDGRVAILALHGPDPVALAQQLEQLPTTWDAFALAAEASRSTFNRQAPCRMVLVAEQDQTDLAKLYVGAVQQLRDRQESHWHTPDGAFFGRGSPGKLAVLFPGQGSQSLGMLRDLACLFPEMLDVLDEANHIYASEHPEQTDGTRLSDIVYPPTTFDKATQTQHELRLRATQNAQPALGAVSWGAWRVLHERFAVQADLFAGHSFGEVPALTAAWRMAVPDLFRLACIRGRLMAEPRGGDPGAMIAVFAPLDRITRCIAEHDLDVVVANQNAPNQSVLSGATEAIARASDVFQQEGLRSTRLSVSAAFHSPLVADAAEPFRAALAETTISPGTAPVFANTTAEPYPEAEEDAKDLLGHQLARPVRFADQIRNMLNLGVTTLLEVGPGSVLSKLSEATVTAEGRDVVTIALDASNGRRSGVLDLARALAQLAACGHDVALTAWEAESRCRPRRETGPRGMSVPVGGANTFKAAPSTEPKRLPAMTEPSLISSAGTPAMAESQSALPSDDAIVQALQMTQQTLAALQQMQEQTAQLHRQFLEAQETSQRALANLVTQQNALLFPGAAPLPVPIPQAMPVPPSAREPVQPVQPAPVIHRVDPPRPAAPQPVPVGPPLPVPEAPLSASKVPTPVVIPSVQQQRIPATAPTPSASSGVSQALLAVVAEKTGYPVEMLDLSMALDADLGIDSIKRVEILSALQERLPDAPVVKPEHLGTLHTLQDVAAFLSAGAAGAASLPAVVAPAAVATAAAVAAAPLPTSHAAPSATGSLATISQALLAVVAEKTGYPVEMLDLSMALDADLGIDSIKRVEILSALQERLPDAPVVKPEHLGTLHTLQDVAAFLAGPGTASPGSTPTSTEDAIPTSPPPKLTDSTTSLTAPPTTHILPKSSSELKEYPTEPISKIQMSKVTDSILLPGQLLALSEMETVAEPEPRNGEGSGAFTVPDQGAIERSIVQAIDLNVASSRPRILLPEGGTIWVVAEKDPICDALVQQLTDQGYVPVVQGWSSLPPAIEEQPLSGLILLTPGRIPPNLALNRLAFQWLQAAGPLLRRNPRQGSAAVVMSVARLDGSFGLSNMTPKSDPTSGGLAGIIKTARHEWPELAYKAIDLAPEFANTPDQAAQLLIEELLAVGPIEVGIHPTHRCTLELARTVGRRMSQRLNLGPKDVVLVTGGGRGVTAEAAVALAQAFQCILILTGRTPAPTTAEPEWIANLTEDSAMKRAIGEHLGRDATPKAIGEQFHQIQAQREIRQTLARIEAAGGRGYYSSVNVSAGRAVADFLHQVQVKHGPITGLIHGAGVLADRKIEALTPEQFDQVYTTKVDGLQTLLNLISGADLKSLVLFSSTTARLGRTGQLAYAAANEVLNKIAQVEARRRPQARVIAINWGPWEGGMVTPGLRKVFESEGVGLIPLADGGQFVVQELNASGQAVEVIALGRKNKSSGVIASDRQYRVPGSGVIATPAPVGTGNQATTAELSQVFERLIDVATHPILRSHVLDGRAVLPMALHLEWLAHAALHGNPGLVFHGFNDLRITHGIMVEDGVSQALKLFAGKAVKHDKLFVVPVELRGRRRDGRDLVHSRAEIVLTAALPKAEEVEPLPLVEPYPHPTEEVYRYFLFHGPDMHGIEQVAGVSDVAFIASAYPAPTPAEWFTNPLRSTWVADPLVLDASFQMMILWSFAQHGAGSLPCFAGRYRQYRRTFPTGPTRVVIRVTRDNGSLARADLDYLDMEGALVAQMQDYECVIDAGLNQAFRRNQLNPLVKQ